MKYFQYGKIPVHWAKKCSMGAKPRLIWRNGHFRATLGYSPKCILQGSVGRVARPNISSPRRVACSLRVFFACAFGFNQTEKDTKKKKRKRKRSEKEKDKKKAPKMYPTRECRASCEARYFLTSKSCA